uniref:CKLF like MARVEL transmembrane domain containing 5 n=1 Tax=Laticauda laticaudata TaxID=8630 RepID=A0A8C5RFJ7_LATLA
DVWTSVPRIPHPEQNQLRSGLCFLVFLLLTASVSAYMGAALLEMLVTLTFLGLRATYYHERLTRVNWPCLVGKPLGFGSANALKNAIPNFLDFLRCVSAAIIFIVVGFAVIATNHEGSAVSAFVFSLILIGIFCLDAYKTYQAEMGSEEGEQIK